MPSALQQLQSFQNAHYYTLASWNKEDGAISVFYDFQLAGTVPLATAELQLVAASTIPGNEMRPLWEFEQALQAQSGSA